MKNKYQNTKEANCTAMLNLIDKILYKNSNEVVIFFTHKSSATIRTSDGTAYKLFQDLYADELSYDSNWDEQTVIVA
jgi:sulfur transfer complex TusBCD TusB component (DsrH family)